ncbi:hypothetical protein [Flagellimonas sp.]|uniref:hypothetical protein n=1 Tax=Flagellimonas sp. TaxID=2058762 RepID=UPI003BA8FF8A
MKNSIIILVFLMISNALFSQKTETRKEFEEDYIKQVEEESKTYQKNEEPKKVIQKKLLDKNLSKAFGYVILSDSDLSSNMSAFGYSQNKDKTNVSVNGNIKLWKKRDFYLRFGGTATGTKNIFELYSDGSWSNNVGANIGVLFKLCCGGAYFNLKDDEFNNLKTKRRLNALEPIRNKKKYSKEILQDIDKLLSDLEQLNDGIATNHLQIKKKYHMLLDAIPKLEELLKQGAIEEMFDILIEERKKIEVFVNKVMMGNEDSISDYIKNTAFYNFDKANDKSYGYYMGWVDANINISNSNYSFTKDNIEESIFERFTEDDRIEQEINVLKATLSLSFNYTANKKNMVWFGQLGASATRGSYLESSLINGTPKVFERGTDEIYVLRDENEQELGRFDDIKNNLDTGQLYVYGAIFFTEQKNLGLNLSLRHEYLLNKEADFYYKNNFTALFGPVFRKVKDGETSITFGIDVGWANAPWTDQNISNDFTARIRLGIPFNIYSKNKESKESKKE